MTRTPPTSKSTKIALTSIFGTAILGIVGIISLVSDQASNPISQENITDIKKLTEQVNRLTARAESEDTSKQILQENYQFYREFEATFNDFRDTAELQKAFSHLLDHSNESLANSNASSEVKKEILTGISMVVTNNFTSTLRNTNEAEQKHLIGELKKLQKKLKKLLPKLFRKKPYL